jgi:hypothetical protein
MNTAEASKAIFAAWMTQWPALALAAVGIDVPYTVDNISKPEGDELFARVRIISLDSQEASIGPRNRARVEHSGLIEVRLSEKPNNGRERLDLLAGAVRQIYQKRRLGRTRHEKGVVTHATQPSELTRDKESTGRWIISYSTPFEFIEINGN